MHVELVRAEPVHRNTVGVADQLGAEHITVERVRTRALGYVDDGVIQADLHAG